MNDSLATKKTVNSKIIELIEKMTMEEKFAQMNMYLTNDLLVKGELTNELLDENIGELGIGAFHNPWRNPQKCAKVINRLQQYLLENTRLKIPALVIGEGLHGVMSPQATIFPQSIGLSSTWNKDIIKEIAKIIAKEARSIGINQLLSPNLDLARDARWGRVEETYGEDPYLTTIYGIEYIKGLQGEEEILSEENVASTLKHFVAHGEPEGGINLAPVSIGERKLREVYLPVFERAIKEANPLCVMPAYNEYDGVPCSGSKELLNDLLREELEFEGYIISDFTAIDMLCDFHCVVEDIVEAGKLALESGIDMEAPVRAGYGEKLIEMVKDNKLSEDLVDEAVSRILQVKYKLGLFDNPYVDVNKVDKIINCKDSKKLALKAAQESIVLLKNENNILPLKQTMKSLAVIGPNADCIQLGDYSMEKKNLTTPLQGIKNKAAQGMSIRYAKGCELYGEDRSGYENAITVANESEVAVIFLGETSMMSEGIGWGSNEKKISLCGEGYDTTDLNLAGVQEELIKEIVKTGTPTIVVLQNGRPLSINWIKENVPGIIEAWYPGEEGGNAIADILFGNANPSGKLSISFPKSAGHQPSYYNHKPSAKGFYNRPGTKNKPGRDYVFTDPKPLFEFGYGLSYTTFEYNNLQIDSEKICIGESIELSINITNTGNMDGQEVIQLYLNDLISSVTTPVKELKRFEKVVLKVGEKKKIIFRINAEDMSLLNKDMKRVVEPGVFEVMIGNKKGYFEVIGEIKE